MCLVANIMDIKQGIRFRAGELYDQKTSVSESRNWTGDVVGTQIG